jgi:hypothetical protein
MLRRPMRETSLPRRTEAVLRAVLPRTVKLRVASRGSSLTVHLNGAKAETKWMSEGGLRQAREVLSQRGERPDVVVARHLSPGAREALSRAGIGWADESGAAEIALGSIVVSRTGRLADPTEKPPRWTPSVLAVAEAVLCGTKSTVSAVQLATGLSSGSCTQALNALSRLGLLASEAARGRGSARRVVDPERLLDAYAAAVAVAKPGPSLRVGVTWRDMASGLADAGKTWKRAGVAWAATSAVAASVIAPYLTEVTTADVYVDGETMASLQAIAADAGLRPMDGGRLTLRPFPTVSSRKLATETAGLQVAPWPRVYADLRTAGVRGEEAAEHLREFRHGR